jgi:hypothetical protein
MALFCDSRNLPAWEIVARVAKYAVDSIWSSFTTRGDLPMKKLFALALLGLFAYASAYAAENSQQNKMKACQAQAGEKKLEGQARQDYVNNCLKAKPEKSSSKNKMAECNAKTKGMSKEDADKARSECMKAT